MAQHDYNLSNNTGALYRADNNAALQAIVTQNSGSTAPSVTFPGMLWTDLSGGGDGVVRRRNQANTAWLTDIGIDQVARDAAAAAQTTANNAMPKAGGTFTGAINLIAAVPTGNQAVSRTNADALYQVRLPTTPATAGTLLYRSAAGWDQTLVPAANGTLLALSGGLPVWQTPTTVAAPNSIVRTLPDGTLDPSLIPSVASGLRFRGTFKPAVNAEYPTTGGSGSGGAPATGDFWVIDGLTTGGYTFLTGTLAGVTVHNGDSIAKSDGTNWYRMGSSVELDGYMKIDGSTAMTGNLNMGANSLVEVGGIAARAGTPVPLNNFSIDATNVVISPQRGTTGADLAAMTAGRLGTDLGRMQIFVGAGASNTGLLPVRFFSSTTDYVAGDYVRNGGRVYRAPGAVAAGAFVASQWSTLVDTAGNNFTGIVGHNNGSPIQFYRADSTLALNIAYDSASDTVIFARRNTDGTALENAIQIGATTGLSLRSANFMNAATFSSSGTFTGACRIKQNLEFVRTDNSNSLIITHDNANNYVRFSVRDAASAGVYDAIQMSQTQLTVRKLYCPDHGIVFGSSTLGSAAGLELSGQIWTCKTSNNDSLETVCARRSNGSAWDSASWFLRRKVDGTNQSSIEFGPSAENMAFAIWGAVGRALTVANTTGHVSCAATLACSGHLFPTADGTQLCGLAANRWASVYAVNGTINTSDARDKSPVTPFTAEEYAAAPAIMDAFGHYNWRPELNIDTLTHYGTTAQGTRDILTAAGVDVAALGAIIHDTWEAVEGDAATPGTEAGDRYSLNYTELFALCLSNLNARVRAMEAAQ